MRKVKILVVAATVAALSAFGLVHAGADPEPGGNNPAKVCVPDQNPQDPPPCPGK